MAFRIQQTLAVLNAPIQIGPNNTNETQVFSVPIPVGFFVPGATFGLRGGGRTTSGAQAPAMDFRARLGPNSLSGAILGQHHEGNNPVGDMTWRLWAANNITDAGFWFDLEATVQANGTDVVASGVYSTAAVNQVGFALLPVKEEVIATFDPALANILELTFRVDRATASMILTHLKASVDWYL